MPQDEHTLKRLDTELDAIRALILEMGGLVEAQFEHSLHALFEANAFLARQVVDQDRQVNWYEVEIDAQRCAAIARHQPTASDLRLIITASKIIVHLERIGDEAKKIARMEERFAQQDFLVMPRFSEIRHVTELARKRLREVLDSFARLDTCSARKVMDREDVELENEEFRALFHRLIGFMTDNPHTISAALEILFVTKAIENISEHIEFISELVIDASSRYSEIKLHPAHESSSLSC